MSRRRNNKKWLWWAGGVALVAIVVVIGVVIWRVNSGKEKTHEVAETEAVAEQEKQDNIETKQTTEDTSKIDEEEAAKHRVVQYEGGDPNMAEELSGALSYASVVGDKLMIRVMIDQYLASGVCNLTLSRNGNIIYSDAANIVGDVSTATCEGFDVPVGELGGGNITIDINLSADGKSGIIRGEASI